MLKQLRKRLEKALRPKLARALRAWSEALAETGREQPSARDAYPSDAPAATLPVAAEDPGPAEPSAGPPAHWVALIRERAPHLLEGRAWQQVGTPAPPTPAATPAPKRESGGAGLQTHPRTTPVVRDTVGLPQDRRSATRGKAAADATPEPSPSHDRPEPRSQPPAVGGRTPRARRTVAESAAPDRESKAKAIPGQRSPAPTGSPASRVRTPSVTEQTRSPPRPARPAVGERHAKPTGAPEAPAPPAAPPTAPASTRKTPHPLTGAFAQASQAPGRQTADPVSRRPARIKLSFADRGVEPRRADVARRTTGPEIESVGRPFRLQRAQEQDAEPAPSKPARQRFPSQLSEPSVREPRRRKVVATGSTRADRVTRSGAPQRLPGDTSRRRPAHAAVSPPSKPARDRAPASTAPSASHWPALPTEHTARARLEDPQRWPPLPDETAAPGVGERGADARSLPGREGFDAAHQRYLESEQRGELWNA